jgi:SAM-dependent methyltransferase
VSTQTRATSERFGYGWTAGGPPPPITAPVDYHLHAMQAALGAPAFTGRVLDAGCGEGIDLASVSFGNVTRAVGVELSNGGIAATSARIAGRHNASLIQGNLLSLPFLGADRGALFRTRRAAARRAGRMPRAPLRVPARLGCLGRENLGPLGRPDPRDPIADRE